MPSCLRGETTISIRLFAFYIAPKSKIACYCFVLGIYLSITLNSLSLPFYSSVFIYLGTLYTYPFLRRLCSLYNFRLFILFLGLRLSQGGLLFFLTNLCGLCLSVAKLIASLRWLYGTEVESSEFAILIDSRLISAAMLPQFALLYCITFRLCCLM